MAYINPQYQIDAEQNARNDRNQAAIGNAFVNGLNYIEENRKRALDQARQEKALALQQEEGQRNKDIHGKKMSEYDYLEKQRTLDPLQRDEFKQKEAIAKIDSANELKKLMLANQNAQTLKQMEVTAKGPTLAPGEEAIDKNYAEQFNNFTGKGINNTAFTIKKLENIASEMEKDKGKLTTFFGESGGTSIPLPDMLRSKDSIRRRDEARNAANSTLKELFGGQLSDGERVAAAKEYYNDSLDNETNAKMLREKITQLKANRDAEIERANYFAKNRTLKGFTPKTNRIEEQSDVNKHLDTTKKMSDDELLNKAKELGVIK
jgi:hypothetical protein